MPVTDSPPQSRRRFLLETKADTTTRLEKDVTDFNQQIEDMKVSPPHPHAQHSQLCELLLDATSASQKNKEYLERQYKDSEGNLRELLRHR